ncbi:Aldehyde Dehydrogenase [Haliangium ochraceum DSM 14365]|uniref:Aldehyde Dehydrogenase n=2 Tax=Haliangium ochraceum TaxID=80816 RepID=D0LN48_HALO1|nr:Aldehyde Dehydrogenase [Haliangium ochraceum DSM 14365]
MEKLESFDPATGERVGSVAVTPVADIDAVVARARAAQPPWQALGATGRGTLLQRAAETILGRLDELAGLLTREMGKPLREARGEIQSCATSIADELVDVELAIAPEVVEHGGSRSTVYRDPYGVCAAITPWNFPFAMPHWMVFPALATGNTVVLKPSEETPLIAQAYVDALNTHLPAGVLQIVHGRDPQGKALVAADVDMIAFTGSRDAGKHILASAADSLKRVVLELGGKDPLLVLDSADLVQAAKFAARNSFRNAGQVCVSTERIYVHESVAEAFTDLLIDESKKMKQGPGSEADSRVGPMINARQRDHVLRQIDEAVGQGARVRQGGSGHEGLFVTPTVLTEVTHEMAIARDETFGPVACVIAVRDDDEAVRLANDTPYGLGAAVFGADDERTRGLARRLTAGMIGINRGVGGGGRLPWVGARQSGYGFHGSRDGHRQFTQTRVLSEPHT